MKNNLSHYNMDKSDLKKLTKSQLIKLLLKQEKKKPVPATKNSQASTSTKKKCKRTY